MQGVFNPNLWEQAQDLHEQFDHAEPFRHVLITEFLASPFLESVSAHFPKPVEEEMLSEFGDRSLKHTVEDVAALGEPFLQWDALLKSREFIGLHRRLNLIVYLCPEWDLSWGGCLKLQKDAWDRTGH